MDELKLTTGDKVTMAGCGTGPNGEFVFNGHTADGMPCEVVTLRAYEIQPESTLVLGGLHG